MSQGAPDSTGPPGVDFYVLSDRQRADRFHYACRLTEKIWKMGHRVYVNAGTESVAASLDDLMWTFREESFLPHAVDRGEPNPMEPVLIGAGGTGPSSAGATRDVLVNLADDIPDWAFGFNRIADVVPPPDDAQGRQRSRDRFRAYRDRGCEVRTHDV